jgi:hypothetical protein
MHIDPDKPGLLDLLRGEGEAVMQILAWAGLLILAPLIVVGTVTCWAAVL